MSASEAPEPIRREVASIDTELGAGQRTIRISRSGDVLVVSEGLGTGDGFNRPSWYSPPLVLPAAAIGRIRAALEALEGEG